MMVLQKKNKQNFKTKKDKSRKKQMKLNTIKFNLINYKVKKNFI